MKWQGFKARLAHWRERAARRLGGGRQLTLIGAGVIAYLLLVAGFGWYWSREPEPIAVLSRDDPTFVVGASTTRALIEVASLLLDKPGGFISNDITPPGVFMDNMPSWEYGVLIQVRDLTRAMRESFSRSQSQSKEDIALARAEPRLNFSNNSWAIPASEAEYREGIRFLDEYLARLSDPQQPQAQFYARADNLRYWLSTVETRLGSLSQRLSASVGKRRLNTDLANEAAARQSTTAPMELEVKTPWLELDDVFYEARGTAWALIHFLRAAEADFGEVLANKNARVSLQQIIRELEETQQALYSPMILNGSGFGMLANHSLVMASYISRANAAIINLRELLAQG